MHLKNKSAPHLSHTDSVGKSSDFWKLWRNMRNALFATWYTVVWALFSLCVQDLKSCDFSVMTSPLPLHNSYKFFWNVRYVKDTSGKWNNSPPLPPKCMWFVFKKTKHPASPQHTFMEYYKPCSPFPSVLILLGNTSGGISCKQKGTNGPDKFKIAKNTCTYQCFSFVFFHVWWSGSTILIWLCPLPCYSNNTVSKMAQPFPKELSR